MGKVLSRLDILLFANTAQYRREMNGVQSETKTLVGEMRKDLNLLAKAGVAGLGAVAGAVGVLVNEQTQLVKEMTTLSQVSNTSVQDMQKLSIAAKSVGVEQDKLGDIYKDTQDKIGDFLSSGGGAMADFFENIAPQVGVTAEEFRKLSGPDALQLYYDSLEQANLSQSEMTFYMEAIASDATNLIPLLHDGGAGFDLWAKAAENAGAVMDDETIRATRELKASTDLLDLSVKGAKNQFLQGFMPVLSSASGELVSNASAANLAKKAGDAFGQTLKFVTKMGIGVHSVMNIAGTAVGGLSAAFMSFISGNFSEASYIISSLDDDINSILNSAGNAMLDVDKWGEGATNSTVQGIVKMQEIQEKYNRTLGLTGQQYKSNAKDAEQALKASRKHSSSHDNSNQMMVYRAFRHAGLSDNQARIITAEVGRENDYASRYLWGGHSDPHNNKYNLGMISWQGNRGKELYKHLSELGLMKNGKIKKGQESLNAQAMFLLDEMRTKSSYKNSKQVFLNNPNVSYEEGTKVLGKNFIRWRYSDPNYAHHHDRRNSHYKKINHRLGNNGNFEQYAKQTQKHLDTQAKAREAIIRQYVDEEEKLVYKLADEIERIRNAGFNEKDEQKYIKQAGERAKAELAQFRENRDKRKAVERLDYDEKLFYATQWQKTEEERINNIAQLERDKAKINIADAELLAYRVQQINHEQEQSLERLRTAHEQELQNLTSKLASPLEILRQQYADQRTDIDNRSDIGFSQKWQLRQALEQSEIYDVNQLQKSAQDAFEVQQAEMNGTSQFHALEQQLQARYKVIEDAHKAEKLMGDSYRQAKLQAEIEFENAQRNLIFNTAQQHMGGMTALLKSSLGEQHTLYKVAFAGQKAMAIAQAILNIPEAYSKAFNAVVGIPFVGPTLAPIAGATAAGIQVAQKAMMQQVQMPSLPGFQTGGFTGYGKPDEVAGLVHKKEFVAHEKATRDYRPELEAMNKGTYERDNKPNITIINNAPVGVSASTDSSGKTYITIDELPALMANEAHKQHGRFTKAMKTNYNLQRNLA